MNNKDGTTTSKTSTRSDGTNGIVHPDFDYINTEKLDRPAGGAKERELPQSDRPLMMIIDDNEEVVGSLVPFLQELGFDALGYVDVNAALADLQTYGAKVALVIIDDCLPGASGSELIKSMSIQAPKAKFIVTSGYYSDDYSNPALGLSGARFLGKPFSLTYLGEVIEQIMSTSTPASLAQCVGE